MGFLKSVGDFLARSGKLEKVSETAFILNPDGPFFLTISGVTQDVALQAKHIFETYATAKDNRTTVKTLGTLLTDHKATIQEVDSWVAEFKPKYLASLETQKQKSKRWAKADEYEQEDLLDDFREKAEQALDEKPYANFLDLFESEPMSAEYQKEVAYLTLKTYAACQAQLASEKEYTEESILEDIGGWRVELGCDECKVCERAVKKKYPKKSMPQPPLHVGCECYLEPICRGE